MASALDLFNDALALINAVGQDQSLTDSEAQTCLRFANRQLDSWSTQSLAVYGIADQTFNLAANVATYTIGPLGTWATTRPIRIADPAYTTYQSVTFPCTSMTQGEYNEISLKTQPNVYPYRYLFVNDNPLGIITLWPVPNQVLPITFSIERVLTQLASLTTTFIFPPGYEDAFVYGLAVRLASQFGVDIKQYPDVTTIAKESLANIKKANHSQRKRVMRSGPEYSDMDNSAYPGGPYGYLSWP